MVKGWIYVSSTRAHHFQPNEGLSQNAILSKSAMLQSGLDGEFLAWRGLAQLNKNGENSADAPTEPGNAKNPMKPW